MRRERRRRRLLQELARAGWPSIDARDDPSWRSRVSDQLVAAVDDLIRVKGYRPQVMYVRDGEQCFVRVTRGGPVILGPFPAGETARRLGVLAAAAKVRQQRRERRRRARQRKAARRLTRVNAAQADVARWKEQGA